MRLHRSWTEQHWCTSVQNPHWPFAYAKHEGEEIELKGRTALNVKNLGHVCRTRGAKSSCHRCEDIVCGDTLNATCSMQLQGIPWDNLLPNIETISDTPWAVGGNHRNDFGNEKVSQACVIVSPLQCAVDRDYSNCRTRCWGSNFTASPTKFTAHNLSNLADPMPYRMETDGWEWNEADLDKRPQGLVQLLAGSGNGTAGHKDGVMSEALFNEPTGVAVDRKGNIFVADSGNHVIRFINATTKEVMTLAGKSNTSGSSDGFISEALFDTPVSVALYYDWGVKIDTHTSTPISKGIGELVLLISDANNHRIRKIVFSEGVDLESLRVETLAGRKGEDPSPGFADGDAKESRFNTPAGIAVDDNGLLFVADSYNHLIRLVTPNGDVTTIAGVTQEVADPPFSCRLPCLEGVPGQNDGNTSSAKFFFPSDVAIGPDQTILVVDGNRLRRVTRPGMNSIIQGETYEAGVVTIAGQSGSETSGRTDGLGNEASFNAPSAVTMDTITGRMYLADTASCRIRRVSAAELVAQNLTCETRLDDIIRPMGCASYEPPEDSLMLTATDVYGNIHYNYETRNVGQKLNGWVQAERAYAGRTVHRCQGFPPPLNGTESNGKTLGSQLDTGEREFSDDEDYGQGTAIYVQCPSTCSSDSAQVYANGNQFTDDSSICVAALHANISNSLLRIIILPDNPSTFISVGKDTGTAERPTGWLRNFRIEPHFIRDVHVATVAGHPAAPLEEACGSSKMTQQHELPMEARFRRPKGIAIAANTSLTNNNGSSTNAFLYIADTGNHAIRVMTATCAKVCENGGECISDDKCECAEGWEGDDCSTPICNTGNIGEREVCVSPGTLDCIPGYTYSDGGCNLPQCVQTCHNGGVCSAPDTCSCATGWMDANCTTPVCNQTCGNGGNCTAPNTCSCPRDWTGDDCREPVCRQTCMNGSYCIAPDTCVCPPGWSGHDCSLPVCLQGFLVGENQTQPSSRLQARKNDAMKRYLPNLTAELDGMVWRQYIPCDLKSPQTWCIETNEFDCDQEARTVNDIIPPRNGLWRNITGFVDGDDTIAEETHQCYRLEIIIGERTPFPYENETGDGDITDLWRYTPETPYGWNASFVPGPDDVFAEDYLQKLDNWQAPDATGSDRMIAYVRWAEVGQGKYVCANGGSCDAPDVCTCAPGWEGFDCRIPVCNQGYHLNPNEDLSSNNTYVVLENETIVDSPFPDQGLYECSIRAFTEWENSTYMHEHPNYYSHYMDHHADEWSPENRYQLEPERPYYWTDMGWPATYNHTDPRGNNTNKGWMRNGYWTRIEGTSWKKGICTVEYNRTCPAAPEKALDVITKLIGEPVLDTNRSFRANVNYTDKKVFAIGRWTQRGGACTDQVLRGCKNNSTCVAPDTCECADGWEGDDCTIPICEQSCSRSKDENLGLDNNGQTIFSKGMGNCTLPNTCTCEKGWSGTECEIPLCAQECNNNGLCTAPDTCTCPRWQSLWRDSQHDGGRPLFQDAQGNPQLTGWTGYDCATPICSQAELFVPNDSLGTVRLGGYTLILFGEEPYNNLLRSDLSVPPYYPYTESNDIPAVKIWNPKMREYNEALWAEPEEFLDESNRLCRMRKYDHCKKYPTSTLFTSTWSYGDGEVVRNDGRSYQSGCNNHSKRFSDFQDGITEGFLCNVLEWEQGDYDEGRYIRQSNNATAYLHNTSVSVAVELSVTPTWYQDESAPAGEGVYKCYNMGSCVAPDVCSCPDGYDGSDCKTPLCRHKLPNATVVSCMNGGSCDAKDNCTCPSWDSLLPALYPDIKATKTGYTGTACQIPICVQGDYDETCTEVEPGSEGCYRCLNGGLCTAPDTCTCADGWTGYDCGTPVCRLRADEETILELKTSDLEKIRDFELDPCQTSKQFLHNGYLASQGNCTAPNTCTCFCKTRGYLDENGDWTAEPWHSPLGQDPPIGYIEGTLQCVDGYEGIKDYDTGLFKSCHLIIYKPKWYERYAITLIVIGCFILLCMVATYIIIRRRIRQRYLLARAERRQGLEEEELMPKRRRKRRNGEKEKKKRRNTRKVA